MLILRLLLIVLVAGASAAPAQVPSESKGFGEAVYRVGPGDVLDVESFRHEEISGSFPIEGDGSITYPLIGRLAVAGRTLGEVAALLESLLEKEFYVDVQIQVEVEQYRSQPVTVFGEVAKPGTYYLEGQTSLLQMLSLVGGIKATAGPVVELRGRNTGGVDEPADVRSFSTEALRSGQEGSDLMLEAGDVISVSSKRLYFITGEVASPGQYEIARDLTLMKAISQAGGLGKFASHAIELHRKSGGEKQILEYDISKIRKGKMEDPDVEEGDVVIVKRRFF